MERKKLALTIEKRQQLQEKMEKETEEKLESLEMKQARSHRLQQNTLERKTLMA